jgi:TatA/E family protein of Tat protein translocase
MFGSLGVMEIALIVAVALIVFGPRKLPEIGRTIGKALGEFRKATDDLKSTIEREVRMEELKSIAVSAYTPIESISRSEPADNPYAFEPQNVAEATAPEAPAELVAETTAETTAEAAPESEPETPAETKPNPSTNA